MKKVKEYIEKNKKWKNRAFTLVELLGVMVVLSLIALILVPVGNDMMEKSRRNAFINSVKNAIESVSSWYAADDFKSFPITGEEAASLTDLKNNHFISGKFDKLPGGEIVAKMVSNGRYCGTGARGDLEIVLGECYLLDHTPPTNIKLVAGTITSNSIQVIASAIDEESDIVSYEFSNDGGKTFSDPSISNQYQFTKLKNGTSYSFQVRVTNQNKLSATSEIVTIKTLDITPPTYTVNPAGDVWAKSKTVTIHYPTRQSNFIYEYTLDSGKTWQTVASGTTKDILFTASGSVTARVRDGYNVVSGSTLTVTKVDSVAPSVPTSTVRYDSASGTVRGNSSAWTNRTLWWGNFSASDNSGGSGINRYEYSQNCTGSDARTLDSSYTYPSTRNSTFCIRAVDNVGNASAWSSAYYFRVDKTNPTCITSGGRSSWSKSPLTLTGTCSDDQSGCQGNVSKYFSTTTSTASPGIVYDAVGNWVNCPTAGVYIDTTPPNAGSITGKLKNPDTAVVSGTTYTGGWTNQYVQVSASGYSDGHSGVNRVEVIVTGASTNGTFDQTSRSIQASGVSNIKFRVWDNAGNYADTGTLTTYIDRKKPYTPKFNSISLSGAKKTSQSCTSSSATETSAITCTINVTATAVQWGFTENVSVTDQPNGSGVKKQQYMWNHNGTNSNGYTYDKCTSWVDNCNNFSGGWKPSWIDFSIRGVDNVGNASSALKIAFKITW